MKNFLESLYQIENFGIYLFVFIGVLIVLFLVILFFGKKDSDKKEKENTELPKVIEEPKKEEPKEETLDSLIDEKYMVNDLEDTNYISFNDLLEGEQDED